MKFHLLWTSVTAVCALLAPVAAGADPSGPFLTPALQAGQRLHDVFSKTVSIKGAGFEEYAKRVAGSANYTVTASTPDAVTFNSDYRYDGYSSGSGDVKILRDGITNCYQGACSVNDETSGVLFNPLLWGTIPKTLEPGAQWTAHIARSWEIGPPGDEQVRVVRLDPANHVIALVREGRGEGPSSDDQALKASGKQVFIQKDGKPLAVSVIPGESRWSGYTTVCGGVIESDVLVVQRHVTLVAADGERFEAEERSFTLLDAIQDAV